MRSYTCEDCDAAGYGCSLINKVVVLSEKALPPVYPGQLFLCLGISGFGQPCRQGEVVLASLSTGEVGVFRRGDVLGTLKPEILPDEEKLQLSQIRPAGADAVRTHEPQYSGYCFLPDGRYTSGVWLCSPREVMDFIEIQKPYQHRVLICDRDDFAVMEIVGGKLVYPDEQALEEFRKEQKPDGGMIMT